MSDVDWLEILEQGEPVLAGLALSPDGQRALDALAETLGVEAIWYLEDPRGGDLLVLAVFGSTERLPERALQLESGLTTLTSRRVRVLDERALRPLYVAARRIH